MHRPLATLPLLCLLAGVARAADGGAERPRLPGLSPAGDDGTASMWVNPANLAFDPDPSYIVLYGQDLFDPRSNDFAAATNAGPLAAGLQYRGDVAGAPLWSLNSGLGLKIERDLAVGVNFGWQLPAGGDNNFTTWDLGLGYRPLPWLGLAATVHNLGEEQPTYGVDTRYALATAVRPWGDKLMLGLDYSLEAGLTPAEGVAGATLRAHPIPGLVLRAAAHTDGRVGGGLELYFGGPGAGAYAGTGEAGPEVLAWLTSADEQERIFGAGRVVPAFTLGDPLPYEPATGLFAAPTETYVHLIERVRKASEDSAVRGIVLHIDDSPLSMAQVQELRGVLARARENGKTVVAYMDRASSAGAYLLASAADKVFLHPAGEIELVGVAAELTYLRGALDLVGVEPEVVRRAEYKSAYESFTNTESSPANREQMDALLDDVYAQMVADVAASRGKTAEQVRTLIDQGPFTASEAKDAGLVDGLAYPDELERELEGIVPKYFALDDEYATLDGIDGWRSPWEVAVVYVAGVINTGDSKTPGLLGGERTAGSATIVRQLDQAREEDSVKAVVLRVDSPGGSAFASDEIWRAVVRLRQEKPVIVSMGGVAASGGYYVSAGATAIYAEPSTITGSIGVISGKFNVAEVYEKLGVNTEEYRRGRNANLYTVSRPWDAEERATVERLIDETYEQFKEKVGEGRHLSPEKVEELARGRVWSGTDARANGLVDELGGFHDALDRARKEAKIPETADIELITYLDRGEGYKPVRTAVQALAPDGLLSAWAPPALSLPPELSQALALHALADESVLALMPYRVDLK